MLVWTMFVSLAVGLGATLIVLFACMFELVRCSGLANQSIVMKRVFKLLGIIELSEEEKLDVIREIEREVTDFMEVWEYGDSGVLAIPLAVLGLDEYKGLESILDALYSLIEESSVGEHVVDIELDSEGNLLVHLMTSSLCDKANERDFEWQFQRRQEEQEWLESRGVI